MFGKRKITKQGGSCLISLPMQWMIDIGIDVKEVKIEMDADKALRITPVDIQMKSVNVEMERTADDHVNYTEAEHASEYPTAHKLDVDKFLEFLRKRGTNKIIKYPEVFHVLSSYKIKKDDGYIILFDLEKRGLIKNVPYHGIRLGR